MTPESPNNSEINLVLKDIKNLYENAPNINTNDKTVEQWGQKVESREKVALELGISRIDIEYTKLEGMKPNDREYYISVLKDDIETYTERGEIPYISRRELKNLERRVKKLNKRTDL